MTLLLIIMLTALVSLSFFFYFKKKHANRVNDRHEHNKERFERLLGSLRPKDEQGANDSQVEKDE